MTVTVQAAGTGRPLNARFDILEMTGRTPMVKSSGEIREGRTRLAMPATARLRVQTPGYTPEIKSVFLDEPRLLNPVLNYHVEHLLDWATYESIRKQLHDVQLSFDLKSI